MLKVIQSVKPTDAELRLLLVASLRVCASNIENSMGPKAAQTSIERMLLLAGCLKDVAAVPGDPMGECLDYINDMRR